MTDLLENDGVVVVTATVANQTQFNYDFLVYDGSHLKVEYRPVSGTSRDLDPSEYSVADVGNFNGGVVTVTLDGGASIAVNDELVLYLDVPIERRNDYQQSGDFLADVIDEEQNSFILMLQQLRRDIKRTILVPFGASSPGSLPAPEVGRVLTWGADGLQNGADATEIANAAANAQTAVDAAAAADLDRLAALSHRNGAETFANSADADAQAAQAAATQAQSIRDSFVLDADYLAYIDAVQSIDSAKSELVLNIIHRLKSEGLWSKFDILNIDFGINEAAFLTNLVDPNNVQVASNLTYTASQGFLGNGTSGFVDTGLAHNSLQNLSQDSGHAGFWSLTAGQSDGREMGLISGTEMFFEARKSTDIFSGRINQTAGTVSAPNTSGLGHFGLNRSASDATQIYINGTQADEETDASAALSSQNIAIFRGSGTYSDRQICIWHVGSSLTQGEWAALYAILNDARQNIALTVANILQKTSIRTTLQTVNSSGGVLTIDASLGHYIETTMTENISSVVVNNWPNGIAQLVLLLTQDATGGRTIDFDDSWKTEGDGQEPAPVPNAGFMTEIIITSYDSGVKKRLSQGATWNG